MITPSLTRYWSRLIDEEAVAQYGLPSVVLMENAGRQLADKLFQFGITGPIAICCGKGNNGGDGFVLARHLDLRRVSVRVGLWADPAELTGDAALQYNVLKQCEIPLEVFGATHDAERLDRWLDRPGYIVDCILGTGAQGEPRAPLNDVIDQLNAHRAPKLACDLPSGLDCDSGAAAQHTIRARHTATFVAYKRGFLTPGADAFTGVVHVLDIGAPRVLVDSILRRAARANDEH